MIEGVPEVLDMLRAMVRSPVWRCAARLDLERRAAIEKHPPTLPARTLASPPTFLPAGQAAGLCDQQQHQVSGGVPEQVHGAGAQGQRGEAGGSGGVLGRAGAGRGGAEHGQRGWLLITVSTLGRKQEATRPIISQCPEAPLVSQELPRGAVPRPLSQAAAPSFSPPSAGGDLLVQLRGGRVPGVHPVPGGQEGVCCGGGGDRGGAGPQGHRPRRRPRRRREKGGADAGDVPGPRPRRERCACWACWACFDGAREASTGAREAAGGWGRELA